MGTIYDIAKQAGVSASTVSRVINDKPGIKASTRERVQKLLRENNYTPNEAARGLVKQSTRFIGILVEDIRVEHHNESVYVIERAMAAQGYTCITLNTGASAAEKAECVRILGKRQVEGAILIGSMFSAREVAEAIERSLREVPVMMVNGWLPLPNVYGILVDEERGVEECVEFLARQGHRHPAFVTDGPTPSNRSKLKGFQNALLKLGQSGGGDVVFDVPAQSLDPEEALERGRLVTRRILRESPETDGVIYSTDLLAVGGLQCLAGERLSVPGRMAVIGIDNTLYGRICTPQLTTLDNKLVEVCQNAARVLLDSLEGKPVSHKLLLPTEVIVRQST